MAAIKYNLPRYLKFVIGGILFVIVLVIAVNFISYSSRRPEVQRIENEDPPERTEKMKMGEFFEEKEGEEPLQGEFDEQAIDEQGLIHAVGHVWFKFKGRYELFADEIVYDQDRTHFLLKGKARILYEDAVLEGSFLEYDKLAGTFKTDERASFSSERITGFAGELIYFIDEERLELKNQVYLELTTRLDSSPVIVEGETFSFHRGSKKGKMEGGVSFSQGESFGSADTVEFELFPGEEHIRSVFLKGNVAGTVVEEREGRIERQIQADQVKLQAFLNLPKIHAIEAEGGCFYKFLFPSGNIQQGESKTLKFVLSQQGTLREFHAIGQARLTDVDGETEEERVIEGESLVIVEAREGLQIHGNETSKARLASKDYEISANEIILDTEKNNLEAADQIQVILNPGSEKRTMGFFSQDKSIFITADNMRYSAEEERFIFTGEVKSWQEKEMLITGELSVDLEAGVIECAKGVKSFFPYESKNSQNKGRVEISARKMSFIPEDRVIVFTNNCLLQAGEVSMTSLSIHIHLGTGDEEMLKFLAKGQVVITQQESEGRGGEAQFDVENETIVLLGNPVLILKDKGQIEGDELTFFIADDRITVKNQGQERSITVIKL